MRQAGCRPSWDPFNDWKTLEDIVSEDRRQVPRSIPLHWALKARWRIFGKKIRLGKSLPTEPTRVSGVKKVLYSSRKSASFVIIRIQANLGSTKEIWVREMELLVRRRNKPDEKVPCVVKNGPPEFLLESKLISRI